MWIPLDPLSRSIDDPSFKMIRNQEALEILSLTKRKFMLLVIVVSPAKAFHLFERAFDQSISRFNIPIDDEQLDRYHDPLRFVYSL